MQVNTFGGTIFYAVDGTFFLILCVIRYSIIIFFCIYASAFFSCAFIHTSAFFLFAFAEVPRHFFAYTQVHFYFFAHLRKFIFPYCIYASAFLLFAHLRKFLSVFQSLLRPELPWVIYEKELHCSFVGSGNIFTNTSYGLAGPSIFLSYCI